MAVLSAWQKITRVLPGLPFGNGADGALTISSNTTQSVPNSNCSGTSGSATLTLTSASTFANNDVVYIHQTRGTGVSQWEINRISSGGGTTTLTLQKALNYTFTQSGASQAQISKLFMYTTVTSNSSTTWSAPNWGGSVGGFLLFAAKVSATFNGASAGNGGVGTSGGGDGTAGVGAGFAGGTGKQGQTAGFYGEGSTGASAGSSNGNANGNGGGAGAANGGSNNGGAGAPSESAV